VNAPPLVSIRSLEVDFRTERGSARVLRDVDIDIPENTVVGVVGESGSGKSTLALALMDLLPGNATQRALSFKF